MTALLLAPDLTSASDWSTATLPARALSIAANHNVMWVCGADELVADSTDGGKTWNVLHLTNGGAVLLTIGLVGERFAYAAGTGGSVLFTTDAGATWTRMAVPSQVVYNASFSDGRHGLIQTPHTIYWTSNGGATWNPVKIDLANTELDGPPAYAFAREVVALDANHMAIVLSQGNADYYDYRLLITDDGGTTWKPIEIAHTGLDSLSVYKGEYWAAGNEVIDREDHGGHAVPLVMHSADGENWTHLVQWARKEFDACNSETCLFDNGAGADFRSAAPPVYWTFRSERTVTAKWAVADNSICSVGTNLKCSTITEAPAIPADVADPYPIPPLLAPPPLNAPPARGPQCIACDIERIMVTQDYQGVAEADLKVHVGQNGLVDDVEVVHATKPEIGDRIASEVRDWIFLPYEQDGVVHPFVTNIKLRVQAVQSK
ncbi:MAG: YCF48-related protein [Candidatus Acidiferrales bacterium]